MLHYIAIIFIGGYLKFHSVIMSIGEMYKYKGKFKLNPTNWKGVPYELKEAEEKREGKVQNDENDKNNEDYENE